jgi:hypothetical protein
VRTDAVVIACSQLTWRGVSLADRALRLLIAGVSPRTGASAPLLQYSQVRVAAGTLASASVCAVDAYARAVRAGVSVPSLARAAELLTLLATTDDADGGASEETRSARHVLVSV